MTDSNHFRIEQVGHGSVLNALLAYASGAPYRTPWTVTELAEQMEARAEVLRKVHTEVVRRMEGGAIEDCEPHPFGVRGPLLGGGEEPELDDALCTRCDRPVDDAGAHHV